MRTIADEKVQHIKENKPGYNSALCNKLVKVSDDAKKAYNRPLWPGLFSNNTK